MARRASFGRYPRANPNITSTLIAISRQMESDRDQLVMDAWKNGGTFEGKKATDEAVLAYWKGRDGELDPADPQYEQIKDNILQLQYGIEQSKQDLLHVQGKLSDQAYANFFLKWAKKVPKDSEFWRVLQKDAATQIEASKAKSRANSAKAKNDAFNNFVQATTDHDIAIGNELTKAVQAMSQKTGLSVTGNGDQILSLLQQDVKNHPDTYHALLDAIHKQDPHWSGVIDHSYFATSLAKADHGFDLIADRANAGGFVTAYASATKAQADMSNWSQNLEAWTPAQSYQAASNAYHRVWDNANASEADKMAAAATFAGKLDGLAATKGIDAGIKGMFVADALRLRGQDPGDTPSFGAAVLGHTGVTGDMANAMSYYKEKADLKASAAPGTYVYAPVGKDGNFDPTATATGVVLASSLPPGVQAVAVPSLSGQAQTVYVQPHAVFASDPNDPHGSERQVGLVISYNVGGQTTTMYSYENSKGEHRWRVGSPYAAGVTSAVDSKGDIHLSTGPTQDPMAAAQALDKQNGTHLADQIKAGATDPSEKVITRDSNGHETGYTTYSYKGGVFESSVTTNSLDANGNIVGSSTSPYNLNQPFTADDYVSASAKHSGDLPGVDYTSPLAASIAISRINQSSDQVSTITDDPVFQQQFLSQTMQTLGTKNALDPRIAQAWQQATTVNKPYGGQGPDDRVRLDGKQRDDLAYPGQQPNVEKGSLTLNFGKDQLKVPNLPSYLNGNVNLQGAGAAASAGVSLLGNLLPGFGLPTQSTPLAPSPVPTATPTPTSTVAPVTTPTYNPGTTPVSGTTGPTAPSPTGGAGSKRQ